jgi:uncharacterized protein (TIGR03435 family)
LPLIVYSRQQKCCDLGMQAMAEGRTRLVALVCLLALGWARAQSNVDVRPQFDVASIKPGAGCVGGGPGSRGPGVSRPSTLEIRCATLENLIQRAYVNFGNGLSFRRAELEIVGGPDWVRSRPYDLVAKSEPGAHVARMSGPMLQRLLEDRFQLKLHRATKWADIYALTVAKSGSKLTPTKVGSCVPMDLDYWPPPQPATGQPSLPVCGRDFQETSRPPQPVVLVAHGMTVESFFALFAAIYLGGDQPIVDRTGLIGLYDFHLEFSRDFGLGPELGGGRRTGGSVSRNPDAENGTPGKSLRAALLDELGLKLQLEKGQVEFLVIDHVERPSAN